jgi:5-methylcytosine-specific restriction enzyme subunit McrC
MLDYATGIGALRRYEVSRQLETIGESLLELIAWLLADACDRLVSDGLLSDYIPHEEALHVLRGRLMVLRQVQKQFGQVDPLEVAFDEFETNIPENQILAATLGATRSIVQTPRLQRRVRRLHSVFHEAADPEAIDPLLLLEQLAYSRRNDHYRNAHHLARLLLRSLAVRNLFTPGGTTSFAFLVDMNELFESFVARLVKDVFEPLGIHVHSQRRDPSIIIDEATGKRYASIIPDLVLEGRYRGVIVRMPVDAKYKLYDERKLDEGDVYQTFFYAFAYAPDTRGGRPARAVILYPRVGDGADPSLRVDTQAGHQSARIQAFGVDVNAALHAITGRRVVLEDVPALSRLHQAYWEVLADSQGGDQWLASSA